MTNTEKRYEFLTLLQTYAPGLTLTTALMLTRTAADLFTDAEPVPVRVLDPYVYADLLVIANDLVEVKRNLLANKKIVAIKELRNYCSNTYGITPSLIDCKNAVESVEQGALRERLMGDRNL